MTAAVVLGTKRLGSDEYANLIASLGQDRDQLARMFGKAWRRIEATTDSNTAAASSPLISLSDEGVTFPADTERLVTVSVMAANGANRFNFVTQQRVLGGTNPTLVGPETYLTDCEAVLTTALGSSGTTTTETAALCKAARMVGRSGSRGRRVQLGPGDRLLPRGHGHARAALSRHPAARRRVQPRDELDRQHAQGRHAQPRRGSELD